MEQPLLPRMERSVSDLKSPARAGLQRSGLLSLPFRCLCGQVWRGLSRIAGPYLVLFVQGQSMDQVKARKGYR